VQCHGQTGKWLKSRVSRPHHTVEGRERHRTLGDHPRLGQRQNRSRSGSTGFTTWVCLFAHPDSQGSIRSAHFRRQSVGFRIRRPIYGNMVEVCSPANCPKPLLGTNGPTSRWAWTMSSFCASSWVCAPTRSRRWLKRRSSASGWRILPEENPPRTGMAKQESFFRAALTIHSNRYRGETIHDTTKITTVLPSRTSPSKPIEHGSIGFTKQTIPRKTT